MSGRGVAYALAAAGAVALAGGGNGDQDRAAEAKKAAVRAKLDEPIPLSFKDAPLEDVLTYLKGATTRPGDTGIPIYVDPEGLKRAGVTAETRVSVDSGKVPLRTSLAALLGRLGLFYVVNHDGLVEISSVRPLTRPRYELIDRSSQNRAIQAKLEEPVEVHFAATPLEDAIALIKKATEGPGGGKGLPIYIDPVGLMEAERTLKSPVSVDAKGEPLKSSLTRMLRPLGLVYGVKDGLLTVTSESAEDADLDVNGGAAGGPVK